MKSIFVTDMVNAAVGLMSDGENPEYDRGLAELIIDCVGAGVTNMEMVEYLRITKLLRDSN